MSTNFFKAWRDLFAPAPLQVGSVTAIADGVATVTLPGGGVVRARGDAIVSDQVFVRDGVIESVTSSLPVVVISV